MLHRPRTVLDAVEVSANYAEVTGHVCETEIRVSPDDDRVIWLVTSYEDDIVIGCFAGPPDELGEPRDEVTAGADHHQRIAQARMVVALAEPEIQRRVEDQHRAIAERRGRLECEMVAHIRQTQETDGHKRPAPDPRHCPTAL